MIKNLFLALLLVIASFVPTSARAEQWETLKAGEFVCGSSTVLESGAVTPQAAAEASAKDWDTCIATYVIPGHPEIPGCFVQPKGTTTQACDYKTRHDPTEEALALARATAVLNPFRALRPVAGNTDSIAPTITLVDSRVKYGYLVIAPKAGAVRKDSIKPICSDGKDNDGDTLIDFPNDPGCESATDADEFNQVKPDQKWADLTKVLLRESDNLCPTYIVANWDARNGMTYSISDNTCTCSNFDAKPETAKLEVVRDVSVARMLSADKAEWNTETQGLTYTEVREYLQEGSWADVTEVDETGSETKVPDDGLGVSFSEDGNTLRVRFPNRCDDNLAAEHNLDYTGADFLLVANNTLGVQAVGMGNRVQSGPFDTVAIEAGIEAGGPRGAFIGTVGVGGWFDDNCASTAAWLGTVRLGASINRSERIGGIIDIRGLVSYGPSVATEITPDDPNTVDNEYAETQVPAWGLNTVGGLIEAGPRFSFGNGVHNGSIAVLGSAGPVQRWVYNPDGSLGTTVTADLGVSVMGIWAF